MTSQPQSLQSLLSQLKIKQLQLLFNQLNPLVMISHLENHSNLLSQLPQLQTRLIILQQRQTQQLRQQTLLLQPIKRLEMPLSIKLSQANLTETKLQTLSHTLLLIQLKIITLSNQLFNQFYPNLLLPTLLSQFLFLNLSQLSLYNLNLSNLLSNQQSQLFSLSSQLQLNQPLNLKYLNLLNLLKIKLNLNQISTPLFPQHIDIQECNHFQNNNLHLQMITNTEGTFQSTTQSSLRTIHSQDQSTLLKLSKVFRKFQETTLMKSMIPNGTIKLLPSKSQMLFELHSYLTLEQLLFLAQTLLELSQLSIIFSMKNL